nr:MAG TPA: hypothetical protein [Caudoviricetes sp.]
MRHGAAAFIILNAGTKAFCFCQVKRSALKRQ